MKITRVGLDLAKDVFQVHAVDAEERVVLRRPLKRRQVLAFFARLDRIEGCVVGMESCCGADYWARELIKLGYVARIMNPAFVKPYVKANKNDARDAEAICEAVGRPTMRFVGVKSLEQHDLMLLHRQREQQGAGVAAPGVTAAAGGREQWPDGAGARGIRGDVSGVV